MELKVNSNVHVYNNMDYDYKVGQEKYINVKSCWNHKEMAEIEIDGKSVWVVRQDLITALNNAGNT
jgi:hypothetical protein